MRRISFFIFLLLFTPVPAHAASLGFVSSTGIFFSKDPFFAGDQVKTYSVVVNNTYTRLTAVVSFLDNGVEIARTTADVSLEQAQQLSVEWVPIKATHTIVAKFLSAVEYNKDGTSKTLSETEINAVAPPVSKTITVDVDSDHDGLGDQEEINTYHTNPLVFDTYGYGMSDGEAVRLGLIKEGGWHAPVPGTPGTQGQGSGSGTSSQQTAGGQTSAQAPTQTAVQTSAHTPPQAPTTGEKKEVAQKETVKKYSVAGVVVKTKTPAEKKVAQKKPVHTTVATTATPPPAPSVLTPSTDALAGQQPTSTPTPTQKNSTATEAEINWFKVLGIIAGLLIVAAGVSGFLAWREQNKY